MLAEWARTDSRAAEDAHRTRACEVASRPVGGVAPGETWGAGSRRTSGPWPEASGGRVLRESGAMRSEKKLAKASRQLRRHLVPGHVADEPSAPLVRPEVGAARRAALEMTFERGARLGIQRLLQVLEDERDDVATRQSRSPWSREAGVHGRRLAIGIGGAHSPGACRQPAAATSIRVAAIGTRGVVIGRPIARTRSGRPRSDHATPRTGRTARCWEPAPSTPREKSAAGSPR